MKFNNDKEGKKSIPIKLGLRPNIQQFLILVLVNAFVGAMIGLEQTVVPLIGKNEFGIESSAIIVSFIASFGAIKAVLNLSWNDYPGHWSLGGVIHEFLLGLDCRNVFTRNRNCPGLSYFACCNKRCGESKMESNIIRCL